MDIAGERRAPEVPLRASGTLLALGVLVLGFFASSYVLFWSPPRVRAAGRAVPSVVILAQLQPDGSSQISQQTPASPVPGSSAVPGTNERPRVIQVLPREAPQTAVPTADATIQAAATPDPQVDQAQAELDAAFAELRQSRDNVVQASDVQRKTLIACLLFLVVFAVIAIAVVVQVYWQARNWNKKSQASIQRVEEIAAQLAPIQHAQAEIRNMLPKLLQEIGDQPLNFQDQGTAFPPKALAVLEDIDHLAYVGDACLAFRDLSSPTEAAVYLNGLLLSAVAHLARFEAWTAFARLDQFLELLTRYPDAVDHHRIAQAYSYRAQAAFQALDTQDMEPSWLRKSERSQSETLSKQGFADVAQASRLDPDWKHTIFVEAQLCSRFYLPDEPMETTSRVELFVRGLRRAVILYKGLIEERAYRGPARHNLVRCLKRIAEQTGEKSDFSELGYALSSFPTDEELADEALSARQPVSQDRFLWQWMLGDTELFRSVDRLNLAEYRSFWIRLLDNKVHLRNWRADLAELQQRNPAMRDWSVQLLHSEPPISLANAISRRQERFDAPSSGA
jgi:flagellar basal body-associated protein FliL